MLITKNELRLANGVVTLTGNVVDNVVEHGLLYECFYQILGPTAFAAEQGSPDLAHTTQPPETKTELFPTDVQTITEDGVQKIVKTYTLSVGEDPNHIPRDSFERDGWLYELTDITQSKTGGTDTRPHTETVEINTDSNDLNDIITQLSPTLEYESEDGYCGLLALDLASVKCEAAGYNNSSYTVTATREYQHLPTNDLYFIPKTITDNGRTLVLESLDWEAQNYVNVGYTDIPDSYRAIAKYTGKAVQSVAIGYITTADYIGEIAKSAMDDTVYTAYFIGTEINLATEEAEPTPKPTPDTDGGSIPTALLIIVAVIITLLAGADIFFFQRHNVKVYNVNEDGNHDLVAKVRISVKNPVIDLTPLENLSESQCFSLEIDRLAAKSLNGKTVDVIFGSASLQHKIAYEGNAYKIEVNWGDGTIKAIY